MLDFLELMEEVFITKFCTWEGRASRKEYWLSALFIFIASILGRLIIDLTGSKIISIIIILLLVTSLVPLTASSIRRLHDTGRSGWWLWINCVPIVGGIWAFILAVLPSDIGDNEYGENPYNHNLGDDIV